MPHRHQELVPLCRVCREAAVVQCPRCLAPLCEAHRPAVDRRCGSCEERFAADNGALIEAAGGLPEPGRTPLALAVFAAVMLVFTIPALALFISGGHVFAAIVSAVSAAMFTGMIARVDRPIAPNKQLRRIRTRFLAERSVSSPAPRGSPRRRR